MNLEELVPIKMLLKEPSLMGSYDTFKKNGKKIALSSKW
jgi:hypothetical protein